MKHSSRKPEEPGFNPGPPDTHRFLIGYKPPPTPPALPRRGIKRLERSTTVADVKGSSSPTPAPRLDAAAHPPALSHWSAHLGCCCDALPRLSKWADLAQPPTCPHLRYRHSVIISGVESFLPAPLTLRTPLAQDRTASTLLAHASTCVPPVTCSGIA